MIVIGTVALHMFARSNKLYQVFKVSGFALILAKGRLISKCSFGVIIWTEIPTRKFDNVCPRMGRAEFVKFFRWYFGRNDETKRTF